MNQPTTREKINKFLFRFKDLSSIGVPTSTFGNMIDNENIYKLDPRRFNFYMQVLESITNPNTDVLEKVLKKENLTRYQRERISEKMNSILDYFSNKSIGQVSNIVGKMDEKVGTNILTQENKVVPALATEKAMAGGGTPMEALQDMRKALFPDRPKEETTPFKEIFEEDTGGLEQAKLEKTGANSFASGLQNVYKTKRYEESLAKNAQELNTTSQILSILKGDELKNSQDITVDKIPNPELKEKITTLLSASATSTPSPSSAPATPPTLAEIVKEQEGKIPVLQNNTKEIQREMEGEKKILAEAIQKAGEKETAYETLKTEAKDKIVDAFKRDPYYSSKNEQINWTDRAIFIALTYIVRALSLFLMEWSIYSGFVKSFTSAFSLYFGLYVSIFLLAIFLTNGKKDDMVFRMLFFYINTKADNGRGLARILAHIACIFILIPVPFVVKEYREFEKRETLTFQEKTDIMNGLDKFSLYVWILTSIVALKM